MTIVHVEGPEIGTSEWIKYWERRSKGEVIDRLTAMILEARKTGCGQPGHVGDGKTCETCRFLRAFDDLTRAKALCREAADCIRITCDHCGVNYAHCAVIDRLRAMGGEP